jgi:D-alanine-D-alanine ligase
VSVITGLQVVEKIDRNRYEVLPVYVAKNGALFALPTLKTRRDFTHAQHLPLTFSRSKATPTLTYRSSPLHHTTYIPEVAYLAFHGGLGEGGAVQGFLDTLGISHTGPSQESAVISMNKQLTKTVIHEVGVPTVPGVALFASDIRQNSLAITKRTITQLGLPAIIKPVHLGSSIGITVAHTDIDLEKALLEASYMDSEVLVETYIPSFVEYNISLRTQDGVIELSEIERPLASGKVLSFADKYEKGAKKTGGSGMASLQRELPAYIDTSLKTRIHDYAQPRLLEGTEKDTVLSRLQYPLVDGIAR